MTNIKLMKIIVVSVIFSKLLDGNIGKLFLLQNSLYDWRKLTLSKVFNLSKLMCVGLQALDETICLTIGYRLTENRPPFGGRITFFEITEIPPALIEIERNGYWMLINRLPFVCDMTSVRWAILLFGTENHLLLSCVLDVSTCLRRTIAHLYPRMINFNAVDF